jgi:ribosomal protein S18 acetylase RimI-like enzyme
MPAFIRPMSIADRPAALPLWASCDGIGLNECDEPAPLAAYLLRNPGMSFVALCGDELVGAVLGGSDGRRGYLHHLAVAQAHRGQGLGRGLVRRSLDALAAVGIARCHILVYADNRAGRDFWSHGGWRLRADLVICSRETAG